MAADVVLKGMLWPLAKTPSLLLIITHHVSSFSTLFAYHGQICGTDDDPANLLLCDCEWGKWRI